MSEASAPKRVTRRTVAKGAAWTVPVVAMATAAPIATASPRVPVDPEFTGNWCKHPGNPKYYHNTMSWTNLDSECSVTVTLGMMDINGVERPASASIGGSLVTQFTLEPSEELCFSVDAGLYGNSANGSGILYFTWTINCPNEPPVGGSDQVETTVGSDNNLPPCGTGADPGGNPSDNPPHADVSC